MTTPQGYPVDRVEQVGRNAAQFYAQEIPLLSEPLKFFGEEMDPSIDGGSANGIGIIDGGTP